MGEARLADVTALRSSLLSRLIGVPVSRLQYWHATALQAATTRPGSKGVPRLYSWSDYQRLRIVAHLVNEAIPIMTVRRAVQYMDSTLRGWTELTIEGHSGALRPPAPGGSAHVAVAVGAFSALADAAGQITYLDRESGVCVPLAGALATLSAEGPLASLRRFADAVEMHPSVNVGLPTLIGTRLETAFLTSLVRKSSISEVAALYGEDVVRLCRVVEFEEAA